jgi:hypothetical protein
MQAEARRVIARQGLVARMLMPDFEDFVVSFPPGTTATAKVAWSRGEVRLQADSDGHISIPDRRDWRRENPVIELSEAPLRIWLRPE